MSERAGAPSGGFVGVIPCAGASARMGRPKALLRVRGETFLGRAVRSLAGGGCDPVFVVVGPGDAAAGREAEAVGARVLMNPDPGEGPITSLRLALAAARGAEGLVYLPVDHPLVRADTVATLLERTRAARPPLALPVHGGERGHPAVFGAALFAELADPSLGGGARTVTHRHLEQALLVDVDDPGVLTDIDTPEVYEAVLAAEEHAGNAARRSPSRR